MRPVRIAHLIPHDGIGGVEIAARSMQARRDLPCDFRIVWLTPDPRRRAALHPLSLLAAVRAALRFDPDVVICSLWRSVPAAILCKLLRPRLRLVEFVHAERAVHWADALFTRIALRAADQIWADSAATLSQRTSSTTSRVISLVIDRFPASPPQTTPRPVFVSWGRVAHQKGIDRAIRLIAALVARGVDARFEVWGPDGGELGSLKTLVAHLGLAGRVHFRGPVERARLPSIAAEASFFLQLSRFEGMGMAVIEAMQMGLVPVVTPVGEIARYVEPGVNGIVVDPDSVEDTVDELLRVMGRAERYDAFRGRAARRWLDQPVYADDVCAAAQALAGR